MVDYSVDMVEQMKACALMQHVRHLDPTRMSAERAIEMATINAAKALGLEREIGSLEAGKRADIAVFDLDKPYVGVLHRPISTFICAGKGSDARAVLVDGEIVYRDGKFARLADVGGRDRRGGADRQGRARSGRPQRPPRPRPGGCDHAVALQGGIYSGYIASPRRSRGWLRSCMKKPGGGNGMDVVAEDVTQIFGGPHGVVALDRFSHHFHSRRFACILGPSGCGKSTLIQIVGGLEPATGGTVRIQEPARPEISRPLGADSVMVWQNLNLFPWRSVIDNIAFGLEMRGMPRKQRYERARALIASVGLRGFENHLPGQLSGGMRQRVALARALIMERPILLMDEPFAALDAQTKIVMQEELLRIFDATHKTVLFVTHAIEEAILLGDEVVVMTARPGRIKEVIEVELPRPRSLEMVNSKEFGALFDRVFHLIREEVMKAMAQQALAAGA